VAPYDERVSRPPGSSVHRKPDFLSETERDSRKTVADARDLLPQPHGFEGENILCLAAIAVGPGRSKAHPVIHEGELA
jgi:hypothetical protein